MRDTPCAAGALHEGRGAVVVLKTGVGCCSECGDQQRYRYQLIDLTNGGGARVDRLWLCPLRHRERNVDERPERSGG
jgi:hypothetical protein